MSVTYGVSRVFVNRTPEKRRMTPKRECPTSSRAGLPNMHNDSQIVENESVPVIEIATEAGDDLTEDTETDLEAECVASFDINCATQTDSVGNSHSKGNEDDE
ncbi:hypothetical protein DPMN_090943 [Dreissena polymorpha]|uniref:Uncharacterized protein n=1 Tax=Dreissena polymorpha TaxID=45954 RepID=A0A9D4R084_DREPO|nr:hypothetical protein DPMN_090943 [Dreissena polymorpha]